MHIGQIAHAAGVNIQTIRFYEREGLLPKPARSQAGYRWYEENDLERVRFIKRNQELGFTLTEIKQLMDLHNVVCAMPMPFRRKPAELKGIITLGRQRLQTINEKIRTLHMMRRQLESVVKQLEGATVMSCPAAKRKRKARCSAAL